MKALSGTLIRLHVRRLIVASIVICVLGNACRKSVVVSRQSYVCPSLKCTGAMLCTYCPLLGQLTFSYAPSTSVVPNGEEVHTAVFPVIQLFKPSEKDDLSLIKSPLCLFVSVPYGPSLYQVVEWAGDLGRVGCENLSLSREFKNTCISFIFADPGCCGIFSVTLSGVIHVLPDHITPRNLTAILVPR